MGCIVAVLAFFFPRVTIAMLVIFGDYIGRAYDTFIWPFLGFFFMPYTTLAYAFAKNHGGGHVDGLHLVLVIIAVLIDLGVIGGSADQARRKKLGTVKVSKPIT